MEESERNALLDEAASDSECFNYLMQTALRQTGEDSADALRRANLSVVLSERRSALSEEAQARRLVGQILRVRGDHSGAVDVLETAKCDADMAEAYRELNLHREALEAYTRAIQEFETLKVDYERARAEPGRLLI